MDEAMTARETQVTQAMEMQAKELEDLGTQINNMHNRLGSVLREPSPTVDEKDCEKEAVFAPLPGEIRSNADTIHVQVLRLRDILERLEV